MHKMGGCKVDDLFLQLRKRNQAADSSQQNTQRCTLEGGGRGKVVEAKADSIIANYSTLPVDSTQKALHEPQFVQ